MDNPDLEMQDRVTSFRECKAFNLIRLVLEADFQQSQYFEKIKQLVDGKTAGKRLIVNINHVRAWRPELAQGYIQVDLIPRLLNSPMDFLPPFELAVNEV